MLFRRVSFSESRSRSRSPLLRISRRRRVAAVLACLTCAPILGVAAVHAAAPPNDAIAAGEAIEGESGSRTGTNVEATLEPGEQNHGGEGSVWYRWTSPITSRFVFETCNAAGAPPTTFDTVLAVYTGPSVSQLRRLARNDDACGDQSRVTIDAEAGTSYYVLVAGFDEDEAGRFTLRWRRLVPPANDGFLASGQLAGVTGAVSGTNFSATLEPGEPAHGPRSVASVWYTWTAPVSAAFAFETCGSSFDSLLAVYTGDALTGLRRVAQNDDGCRDASRVPLDARSGTTYRIAIAGFNESGSFVLRWMRRPANDDVAKPRRIGGRAGSISGSSLGATRQAREPRGGHGASVWFAWRAPSSDPVAFSTCTASFDTFLVVHRPPSGGPIVRANDDGCPKGLGSLVVLHPQRGTTYSVAVDGLRGASGSFRLVWGPPPPYAWCVVPDVRGRTVARARDMLEDANCTLGQVVEIGSTITPRGLIVAQFPLPSSTRRRFATPVNVEVSRGRP